MVQINDLNKNLMNLSLKESFAKLPKVLME